MFKIENAEKTEYKVEATEEIYEAISTIRGALADLTYEMERQGCTDVKCVAVAGFDPCSKQQYTQYCHYNIDDLETLNEDLHNLQRIVAMTK